MLKALFLLLLAPAAVVADSLISFEEEVQSLFKGSLDGFLTLNETFNLLEGWNSLGRQYAIQRVLLGSSTLNNSIYMYGITHIADKTLQNLKGHPGILLNSLLHPQQRSSLAILLYTYCKLLLSPSSSQKYLLQRQTVYMIPYPNIDGTLEIQKLWATFKRRMTSMEIRKNRNIAPNSNCKYSNTYGVDVNRNFDFHFSELGKKSQCNLEYYGSGPFSQKQSQILRDAISSYNIKLAIDFHSYGNRFVYPYAFDPLLPLPAQLEEYYNSMKPVLKSVNTQMDTAYGYLGYRADGVYIDWVASQGVRSFAYQFGVTFEDDKEKLMYSINRSTRGIEQVLLSSELLIVARGDWQDSMLRLRLKSIGQGNVTFKRDENWIVNISGQTVSLRKGEEVDIYLQKQPQQLVLQIVNGQQTLPYTIPFQRQKSAGTDVLVVVLALLSIFAFITVISCCMIYRKVRSEENKNLRVDADPVCTTQQQIPTSIQI